MAPEISCYNCRYFSPGAYGCDSNQTAANLGVYKKWGDGICRRLTPRQGTRVKRARADEYVCFAEWPQVMPNDWCGQFESRTANHNSDNHNCAHCNIAKGDCE